MLQVLQIKAVTAIRAKMSGPPHRQVRQCLIEEYTNKNQAKSKVPDFQLFLDCLLDGSFIDLALNEKMFSTTDLQPGDVPYFNPTSLLETITKHCTNLQSLIISHYYPNIKSKPELLTLNSTFALPLANLKVSR